MWSARGKLLEAVAAHRALVVVGETGSGKTTQIPQFLHEAGYSRDGVIACTQPRRVAAITVAKRVADELGCRLGGAVGYAVRCAPPSPLALHFYLLTSTLPVLRSAPSPLPPLACRPPAAAPARAHAPPPLLPSPPPPAARSFDDVTSPATRIKYCTDGLLLREALSDPLLSRYSVVIIDEAHERTVATDVLFGVLKGVAARRGASFRLLIMSATLDAAKFAGYFGGARAAYVRGRQYPVQIFYTPAPEENYLDAAMTAALQARAPRRAAAASSLSLARPAHGAAAAHPPLTARPSF